MHIRQFLAVSVAALTLAACTQQNGMPNSGVLNGGGVNKQDMGTVLGAGAGGLLGNQIGGGRGRAVATVGGLLLGGFLGNRIGESLDDVDRMKAEQTTQRALETAQPGQALPWQGQQAGVSGVVIPQAPYQTPQGYCREFQQKITVGGKTQSGYGTACRQPDGSWKIVSQQ